MSYFLDTYAMIAYIEMDKEVVKIVESSDFVVSDFQLMELYYILLKKFGEEVAEEYFEAFSQFKEPIDEEALKKAMKLRLEFLKKGKKVSYVDAIGYAYSLEKGLKFVTGDKEFKGLKGVKYIGR